MHGSANSIFHFSTIIEKSYFVSVKGLLFIGELAIWRNMDQTAEIRTDFSFFLFQLYLKFWKYDFIIQTAFLDIFLIFLFSAKNGKLK